MWTDIILKRVGLSLWLCIRWLSSTYQGCNCKNCYIYLLKFRCFKSLYFLKKETVQFNDTLIDPWHCQYWPTLPAPIDKCYLGSADISLLCSSALIIHLLRIFHSFNCVSDRLLRSSAQTFESVLKQYQKFSEKLKWRFWGRFAVLDTSLETTPECETFLIIYYAPSGKT